MRHKFLEVVNMARLDRSYESQSAQRRFFRNAVNVPLLTREHEHELAAR